MTEATKTEAIGYDDSTPAWGIEPVPERLRVLGLLDTGLLWGNLGVSLLVIVAGTYLVPALSLPDAFLAILVGGLIGNTMLALAGMIGADARVPAMVLMRAPLGRRGSYLPTALNVAQCVGWAIFELLIIATAAAALCDELFGFSAQWLWTIVFGGVALALALLGPIGFVRRFVRKVAVWAVPVALAYLTWWALDGAHFGDLWSQAGRGRPLRLAGRRPRRRDHGLLDPARRRLHAVFPRPPRRLLGNRARLPDPDALALLPRRRALLLARPHRRGGAAGGGRGRRREAALALFALMATETDEAFANVYSTAVSLQNLFPRCRSGS